MYVLVFHRISDPRAFRRVRERPDASRPARLRLLHALPSRDRRVLCALWECDSVAAVREHSERLYGGVSRQEYHEVDDGEALGLHPGWPAAVMAVSSDPCPLHDHTFTSEMR